MKIFVNDSVKEIIDSENSDIEKTIQDTIAKLLPEIDISKVSIDLKNGEILYIDNDKDINVKLGHLNNEEDYIYLTTTEIRMILRGSTEAINEEMVANETIKEEVKSHLPEAGDKILELHTHFIEVLSGEEFFEILVEGEEAYKDPNNEGKYIVLGKSYTKEELINELNYPLEHYSGKEHEKDSVKTIAFSRLSHIIALRTQILKGEPILDKVNQNGNEIKLDSKFLLVSRIRKLLISSLEKLEREGVNYVELSYSRTDIDSIFEPPEEIPKPLEPVEEESEDYEEALQKYHHDLLLYERYLLEYKDYSEFKERLDEIKNRNKIEFRFLLSTQRDDWHDETLHGSYLVPKNSIKIIKEFLRIWDSISDSEKDKILNDLNLKIDIEKLKNNIINRLNSMINKVGPKKVNKAINTINKTINSVEDLIEFLKKTKSGNVINDIILYNILFENLDIIKQISDKYPEKFDLTGITDNAKKASDLTGITDNAKQASVVVGYDIMGYETRLTNAEKIFLEQKIRLILKEYKPSEDSKAVHSGKRVIRIHAGETRESSGNVLDILLLIKKIKNDKQYKKIINDFEFRIGHGVFIFDEEDKANQVVSLLIELGIIVEVNLSSNLALDNVDKITEVPIREFRAGVKYVVSTDGGGVYRTTVIQEGLIEHRYFSDDETPGSTPDTNPGSTPNSNPGSTPGSTPDTNPEDTDSSEISTEPEEIDTSEGIDTSSIDFKTQVINEFKNLIYIFYKDFSINNILNYTEIATRMNDIEKNIHKGYYFQAKLQMISCKVLMGYPVDSKELMNKMDTQIHKSKSQIFKVLKSNQIDKKSKLYNTLLLVSKMSDNDILVNYNALFEKYDLNKLLKSANNKLSLNDNDILKRSDDICEVFYRNAKAKFELMNKEEIYNACSNLLLKDENQRIKYFKSIKRLLESIKNSKLKGIEGLKHSLMSINPDYLEHILKSKSIDEINEIITNIFVNGRDSVELSTVLSYFYGSIIEDGRDLTFEEFMKGEDENDRRIKK